MRGLFLQGGGAKGAFQAGVIYALYEKGLYFEVISGTSIGAINSYFIYTKNLEKMREIWTNIEIINFERKFGDDKVIDNSGFMEILEKLEGKDEKIKYSFINYVSVKGTSLKEVIVDITKLEKEQCLKSIKYSALLPGKIERNKTIDQLIEEYNSKKLFEQFEKDLNKGLYDGYNLDGGIINNNLLTPFIKNKVEKIYIVTFIKNYKIPEYLLNSYNKDNIIVIEPNTELFPSDTMRFKKEFCEKLFYEGYEIGKKI